ncbi:YDG domain-containing protein [Eshraghiella crossota]|uniref:YDG domain-containing protein n=1 Tax=Eshraghiella crossota TaxID=45851 RepID=UPI0040271B54
MKMQRLMKKMRRATALILAGLMIAMTVDISGLKVRAEEKQNNDTVIATSDSEKLDVSKLNTEKTSFGVVYSDYIVINEDNVNDFNGKTLTGTTTNGIYISNGVTVDLTIENLNITKSEDISSCISVGYGATLNLTVKGENNLKATGWGSAGIEVMGQTKATLRITPASTGTLTAAGGYGSKQFGSYGGAGIGGMARITSDITNIYVGNIIIEGGTINAVGGYQAAGIGGTIGESDANITITGGTVNATGGSYGAGIGGGFNGNVNAITISGGTVTANAGEKAAAIGVGRDQSLHQDVVLPYNTIRITGGDVTANGNIGYGSIIMDVPANPGTIEILEDVTLNLNGEITLGSSDTTSSGKYTLDFTIYDGGLIKDTTAKITYGDNKVITESTKVNISHYGKAEGSVSFVTRNSFTGEQTFVFTIDGKEYKKTVSVNNSSSKINVEVGTPLYPVTLEFYGAAISKDLGISSITVKQDGKELSADKGEFYAPLAISYNRYGYGTMLCYLPKNSDSTEISVTAEGLNDGNAMTVTGQKVSTDGDNIITMLTTTDILLAVTAEVYGDSAVIHAETNKKDGKLCCHYVRSDTPITDVAQFRSINSSIRKKENIDNGSADITIDNLEENKTYEYYFIVSTATFYGNEGSNIVHLTLTTSAVAEVINADGTSTQYATFDAAAEAAAKETGCTLKLIKDATTPGGVVLDGDFTLDLNGKTLKATTASKDNYTLLIKGKITIKDSVGGGKITGYTYGGLIRSQEGASLTILSGIFEYTGTVTDTSAILCWGDKADLSVQGGIFKSTRYSMEILDLSQDELSGSRIGLSGGRFCNGILQSKKTGYATTSQLLAPGYAYQYMSGDNAGKLTTGDIGKNDDVEIVPANLDGNLIVTADAISAGGTLTANLTVDTDKWVNAIGNYTYTWYRVGESADTVLQTKTATTDTTDTYTLTEDDIRSQIYCVVTTEKCGEGVKSNEITVPGLNIKGAKIVMPSEETYSYNGKAQTPDVTVTLNDKELEKNTDYRIDYVNNQNAGTATINITGMGRYEGSLSKNFNITKKAVTVSGITAQGKIYDGTVKNILNFNKVEINGLLEGDSLTVNATGTFTDAKAGDNKTVTITGLTLGGKDKENYTLADSGQQTSATASIGKLPVKLQWNEKTDFIYNGQKQSVIAKVSNAVKDDIFTLSYENNTAVSTGVYTARVIALGNDNYTLEGADNISKKWSVSYAVADDASISGTKGNNGWYVGTVTLTPPEGYKISNDGSTWKDIVTLNEEGKNYVRYYLRDKNGGITDAKKVEISIDTVAPAGEIRINDNSFTGRLLNIVNFRYFFSRTVNVNITGTDDTSGIDTIEYQKAARTSDYDKDGVWIKGSSLTVDPGEKFIIYARITDNAGHQTIINSDGIVVYTDVAAVSEMNFIKSSRKNQDAGLTLNGNTVAEIIKDGNRLEAGNYSVINDRLVFNADYLDSLEAGKHRLMVTYNPLGETFTTGESKGDTPQTTAIMLNVKKASLKVSAVPEVTPAAYSSLATLGNDFTLTGGVVKAAVDGQEIAVDGTWSWQDADITPTVINSGYTAVFTPTDSTSYDSITSVVPVTITKAVPVIKTVPKTSDITYGQKLSESILSNGLADIDGNFAWDDGYKLPTVVSDSERTEYIIVFHPADSENYENAYCKAAVKVNKAGDAPCMPQDSIITEHNVTTVGEVPLPEDWKWNSDDCNDIINVGDSVNVSAVYNGTDKGNYINESVQIRITRPDHILKYIAGLKALSKENDNTECWICTECRRCFSDKNGTKEIADNSGAAQVTVIFVEDDIKNLTDIPLTTPGWTWASQEKLLPGTIINATAVYKVTDDFTIKDTIQIRVSCKAADVTYKIGADGTVTLRCTGVLSSFKGITVDGKALIQGKDYTAVSGSTIITFNADYLKSLSVGKHTVVMKYDSGDVEAGLTVIDRDPDTANPDATAPDASNPDAGDNNRLVLWLAFMAACVSGLTGTAVHNKKKKAM